MLNNTQITHNAPRILTIANQKGGVGKTTTAINLGTALAAVGENVLLIDLDPQGNASTGLGVQQKSRKYSSFDVLMGDVSLEDAAMQTDVPRVSVIPATMDLLGAEITLASQKNRTHRLKDAITRMALSSSDTPYSYILIDCPPSLNLLTINAMTAASGILVPLQCEFFALEGLSQLLKTVEQVRATTNPQLEIQGIVLTMFDPRNNLAMQVIRDVRDYMGKKVFETVIPRNVRVSEAPSYGKPVLLYDLKCTGSQAYLKLASEVIQRERALCAA